MSMIAKNATSALSQHDGALCKWQMLLFKGRLCWRLSWQLGKISLQMDPRPFKTGEQPESGLGHDSTPLHSLHLIATPGVKKQGIGHRAQGAHADVGRGNALVF